VPRRHARDITEIEPEQLQAVAVAAQGLAKRMLDRLDADGINLLNSCGAPAWQTVFHLHMHVIPRYDGDPLRLPWTPETGDPEVIAATAEQLR
jgi:histidine triad (HIT) family protein